MMIRVPLSITHPDLAKQADGWDPSSVTRNAQENKDWKCKEGHKWTASVLGRSKNNGSGCPICAGKRVLAGFNDLETLNPDLAKQADGWDPSTVTTHSGLKKPWKCSRDHSWQQTVASRTNGRGCPICAGKRVLAGFNDLQTLNPDLAKQADGWDPSLVTLHSGLKKSWTCESGHRWKTTVLDRSKGRGCPSCAYTGFDPNRDGWLYLLTHPQWAMLQIGITNYPDNRIASHKKLGWEPIEIRGPMDGLMAREWETSILKMLRRNGASLGNTEQNKAFDGYTEAWVTESFPTKSLKELMDEVMKDEG